MVTPIHSDTVHTPPVPSVTVVVLRETFEESGLPLVQWSAAASLVQVLRAHKRTGARLAVALQQLGLPLAVFSLVPWSR